MIVLDAQTFLFFLFDFVIRCRLYQEKLSLKLGYVFNYCVFTEIFSFWVYAAAFTRFEYL